MAQQTNILSLRDRSPSFLYLSSRKKLFHLCFFFLKHFSQFLRLNNVFLPQISISVVATKFFLRYTFFVKTSKLAFFSKKIHKVLKGNGTFLKNFSVSVKSFFFIFIQKFFFLLKSIRIFSCQAKNLHSVFATYIGKNLFYQFFFFLKNVVILFFHVVLLSIWI